VTPLQSTGDFLDKYAGDGNCVCLHEENRCFYVHLSLHLFCRLPLGVIQPAYAAAAVAAIETPSQAMPAPYVFAPPPTSAPTAVPMLPPLAATPSQTREERRAYLQALLDALQ